MDTAPLTLAYTHARNAAQETKRSNPVAASEEHDLAAAEFAAAAVTTNDKEALRVLQLLEQHHRQLGQILKDAHLKQPARSDDQKTQNANIFAKGNATEEADPSTTESGTHPPRLARTSRSARRDVSSSIVSNLASARGIPNTQRKRTVPVSPLVSNEHADGTFSQDLTEHKRNEQTHLTVPQTSRPSWTPPEPVAVKVATHNPSSDSPFQQFYNKFEGAIATLTAPLAFASLPLTQQTPSRKDSDGDAQPKAASQAPKKIPFKAEPSPAAVDYSQLISNAALRAVRDGSEPGYSRPHESFYVVPASGGMMSYADITAASYVDRQVSRQHRRGLSNASDEFVDASSQILPQPPLPSPLSVKDKRPNQVPRPQGKTMEELQLENQVMRLALNETTKRLQTFEIAAQTSSAALAHSIRSLHPLSPLTTPENSRGKTISVSGGPGSDLGIRMAQKRIDELEESLKKHDRKLSRRDEENAKLKETLGKYREKWEGLKAGAKARREQVGGGDKMRRAVSNASSAAKDTGQDAKSGDIKTTEDV